MLSNTLQKMLMRKWEFLKIDTGGEILAGGYTMGEVIP